MTKETLLYRPETDDVRVERAGRVATLRLQRPDDQNRLTPDALAKLEALAREFAQDEEIQAIIITGDGREIFSMGILNPALRASFDKEDILRIVRLANRAFDAIEALPQIVIAAFNGPARAGAAELALACDIRVAASNATFCLPEATWGGFPGAGAPVRLAGLVGRGRALELICTGREIGAEEMERYGLVQGVYPPEQLEAAAQELAASIAASGPLAVRGAKRILATRLEPGRAAARELADALRAALEWSADVDEGMAAHREGRAPRFVGR